MKRYVRITNKKTVHRLLLEIIGLGTKQKADKTKVGQWASGFKLATPAALRLGIEVAATSTDAIGPFVLRFEVEDINIEHEGKIIKDKSIVYTYSDGRRVNAPVALGAFPEWSSAIGDDGNHLYPILREYIANARDEDRNFTWEAGVTEVMQAEPGTSAVYMEETSEVLHVLSDCPDRYFKFFGEMPLFRVIGIGAIYPKSSPGETRRFNDGYLVGCKKEGVFYSSSFDYEVYGKDMVNEFRAIKDDDRFYSRLAKLFTRITDKNLLRQIINSACGCSTNVSAIEAKVLDYMDEKDMSEDFKKMCREIWEEGGKKGGLLACGIEVYDSYMRALGYKVFSFVPYVSSFLAQIGVKNSKAVYEERLGNLKFRERTPEETARLVDVLYPYLWRIKNYRESVLKCPIGTMVDPVSGQRGLCTNNYSKIYLAEKIYHSKAIEFLEIILHELDHFETELHDSDYISLTQHKDKRRARDLILLGIALNALEDRGVDISTLHPDFISIKKSQ